MKILETIVRSKPIEEGGILRVSADTEIWQEVENIKTLSRYCLNKFQEEITKFNQGTGGYQIRSSNVMEKVDSEVYIGFLSTPEYYYNYYVYERDEIRPSKESYNELSPGLNLIGYDVCDSLMVSAFSHGTSPFSSDIGQMELINKFGLFKTFEDAAACAKANTISIPEHQLWSPIGVYVTKFTLNKLIALQPER